MTTKEIAQAIRNELKENGYNSRKVGVKFQFAGYSAVIWVTIKDQSISKKEIENIALKYENVYRDEITGEILQGGNDYVFVDYSADIKYAA